MLNLMRTANTSPGFGSFAGPPPMRVQGNRTKRCVSASGFPFRFVKQSIEISWNALQVVVIGRVIAADFGINSRTKKIMSFVIGKPTTGKNAKEYLI